jgi:hypothetical protein
MILLLLPLALGWSGCGEREVKSGVTDPFPPHYSDIRSRILMPRCARCHALVESRQLLLEKWVIPGDAMASELYEVIDSGSMPPYGNKLLDEEIEAVRLWIDAGAPHD